MRLLLERNWINEKIKLWAKNIPVFHNYLHKLTLAQAIDSILNIKFNIKNIFLIKSNQMHKQVH